MGKKAKSSRKGKKAWRANISTDDIHDFFEKSTKDALSGGSLHDLPSESLFFVDKSTAIDVSVKRKIEKHREKVIRCNSILQKNAFVQPVPSSKPKKPLRKVKKAKVVVDEVVVEGHKDDGMVTGGGGGGGVFDLWDEQGEDNSRKARRMSKPCEIPAVEIESAGCSFNPPFESHQDALAQAVAEEMQKVYRKELAPEPVPLTVPGEAIAEEDMYFIDADDGSDGDTDVDKCDEHDNPEVEKRSFKRKRVTTVEKNKRARRKEQLKAEAEVKKVEELSKEIDCLSEIIQEIGKEDEEKQNRHLRKIATKQEKLRSGPPRLGKHRFQPAPTQVLLSEEVNGSLRKLKACCTLASDRFKSFEKRGILVPTAKSRRR